MNDASEILGLDEVAALFRAEPETVAHYARTGELPGTRIGKRWVFLKEDAMAFLRERIRRDTAARRTMRGHTGHRASLSDDESRTDALLLPPSPRPKSRRRTLPELPSIPRM